MLMATTIFTALVADKVFTTVGPLAFVHAFMFGYETCRDGEPVYGSQSFFTVQTAIGVLVIINELTFVADGSDHFNL